MSRAAVIIGVNSTGGKPKLSDAVNGAKLMEKWALDQGMPRNQVLLFTDENGPVEVSAIRKAVRTLVDSGTLEQLIIYFAGHGTNNYSEYWLLSDAPVDSSAAINLEGSASLARHAGIPHVVFISDACRTPSEGQQEQRIGGSDIFPNDFVPGPEQAVDMFFATTLGDPAKEVKDARVANSPFKALYTMALLDAVNGKLPAAITPSTNGSGPVYLVRPRLLKKCLAAELPHRLSSMGFAATVSQTPDARISSDDEAWLARFEHLAVPLPPAPPASEARTPIAAPTPQGTAGALIFDMLTSEPVYSPQARAPRKRRRKTRAPTTRASDIYVPHRAMGSIVVRGTSIAECLSTEGEADIVDDGSGARITMRDDATDVLITLADGSAALLPAIKDYVTCLTIDAGQLAEVAFEPSPDTPAWERFSVHADQTRALREAIAGAARMGVLRSDDENGRLLAARLQSASWIDPALALYAAYAFHAQYRDESVRQLNQTLKAQLSTCLFDIALLAGELANNPPESSTCPPTIPMLAFGWALLSASKVSLPTDLDGIERELLPSLWTHFNATGAARLRAYISTRRTP